MSKSVDGKGTYSLGQRAKGLLAEIMLDAKVSSASEMLRILIEREHVRLAIRSRRAEEFDAIPDDDWDDEDW